MKQTRLYLPITSQPRELDAKLLLALFALERGIEPVIGYKSVFQDRLSSLPPGLFLAHNARQKSEKAMRLRKFGHRVIVLDEEALVRQSDEIFLKKHPQDAFDHISQVYAWGEDDLALWKRSGLGIDDRVHVTGNPRMDIMRRELRPFHAARVDAIRDRYGTYVLLNTNFPTVNNLTRQGGGLRLAGWALDADGRRIEEGFLGNKRALYESFIEMAPALARAIAPTALVIRPHPNEDHRPWLAIARDCANAHVVFEGGVVPWIAGATALVHNNCTTAVEAAVLGTPVLNFTPWRSEWDNDLSLAFGRDCASAGELAAAIARILEAGDPGLSPDQRARLDRHISHLSGTFSSERVAQLLLEAHDRPDGLKRAGPTERARIRFELRREWLERMINLYTSGSGRKKRRFLREHHPHLKPYRLDLEMLAYSEEQFDLLMRQFPPLSPADLDDRIGRFARALDRFEGYRSHILRDNLFTIRR